MNKLIKIKYYSIKLEHPIENINEAIRIFAISLESIKTE